MRRIVQGAHLGCLCVAAAVALSACGEGGSGVQIGVQYQSTEQRVNVLLSRELEAGESLYARFRLGQTGELDCARDSAGIPQIDGNRVPSAPEPTFSGPSMTPEDFETPYDSSDWLEAEPTAEMLAAIADGRAMIDVCLMNGSDVVAEAELDARQALDRRGANGKFDGEEARIVSTLAYAQSCMEELGDIPFFPRINEATTNEDGSPGPADFRTYNCLDSTPIPTTVTAPDGTVTYPTETASQCDNPQYIYSSCEPSAVGPNGEERPDVNGPRVTSGTNDRGTSWVLLCRKARPEVGAYNDIAMIGYNPYSGQACFFQNALYSRTDGLHVPHPADDVNSEESPQTNAALWEGIQGGVALPGGTSNIECGKCHDTDAFIHTPWIDGARDERGDPIVPRMGIHPDFALGYNDQPYYIHNTDGQGWRQPTHITAPEAAPCTACHRIGIGESVWTTGRRGQRWLDRLDGNDSAWTNITTEVYNRFDHRMWMPPDLDGVDEESFPESQYGQALAFLRMCGEDPSNPACTSEEIPRSADGDEGQLPTVDLTGPDLARAALTALGADLNGDGGTRRCQECHAVSRYSLREWERFTNNAWEQCGITEGAQVDPDRALLDFVNSAEQSVLDGDVGLRSDVVERIVQLRPFSDVAGLDAVDGVGPATMRKLRDFASGSATLSAQDARRTIDCLRIDPSDENSVFEARNLGVLVTGVQYGYFRRLFQNAYGNDWTLQYGRFKSRVQMPKGSHRPMSELEYATILTWFRNGLNDLDTVLPEPPPPETCNAAVDTAAMMAHLSTMQFEGWQATNEDNGIRMYGCNDAADPTTCLTDGATYPDRTAEWGNGIGRVVQVHELDFDTSFWMRSSADGRFVGNGGGNAGATITDLQTGRNIGVDASYDPGFFPDNSGFLFQGATGGAGFCVQSVLEGSDDLIDFSENGCTTQSGINLYQHVARGINGGDYFVINSQFTSDSGKHATENPRAPWNAASTIKITPMVFNGTTYEGQEAVVVPSPFEGDSVLSPSGTLVSSRLAGPNGAMLGYVVRPVDATRTLAGYRVTLGNPVATVCTEGAKVSISFDERYMVTHNHLDHQIHLIDLMDGTDRAITHLPEGYRALFPHFVSNGWFYFLVIDADGHEFVTASNAATL
ncbi:MAG: hypothetical protein AB7S26_25395 [Sandaracinaceae bacterium]